jgi:hypothetical protein
MPMLQFATVVVYTDDVAAAAEFYLTWSFDCT